MPACAGMTTLGSSLSSPGCHSGRAGAARESRNPVDAGRDADVEQRAGDGPRSARHWA